MVFQKRSVEPAEGKWRFSIHPSLTTCLHSKAFTRELLGARQVEREGPEPSLAVESRVKELALQTDLEGARTANTRPHEGHASGRV